MNIISSCAKSALFICIAFGLANAAIAKPGDIDTRFGSGGTATFIVSDAVYDVFPEPVAVDRSNRVIVATNFVDGAQLEAVVANGVVDTAFGTGGAISIDAQVRQIAVDSVNRLVLLETDASASPEITRVSRYLSSGAVDTSFGVSGSLDIVSGLDDTIGTGIALDAADTIYVAGTVIDGAAGLTSHMYVAKVTSAGTLDTSFAGGGLNLLQLDSGPSEDSTAWAIALDSSNRIVLTGVSVDVAGTTGNLDAVRLTNDGQLDISFAHGAGFVRTDALPLEHDAHTTVGRSVALDSSGNILIGATATAFATFESSMVAVRYTPDGDLDTGFAGGAPLFLSAPRRLTDVRSINIDGRGNILVSGMSRNPTGDLTPTIFRSDATGTIDMTFGSGGAAQLSTAAPGHGGNIALMQDGQIVTATASEMSLDAWVTKILDYDPLVIKYPTGF